MPLHLNNEYHSWLYSEIMTLSDRAVLFVSSEYKLLDVCWNDFLMSNYVVHFSLHYEHCKNSAVVDLAYFCQCHR